MINNFAHQDRHRLSKNFHKQVIWNGGTNKNKYYSSAKLKDTLHNMMVYRLNQFHRRNGVIDY